MARIWPAARPVTSLRARIGLPRAGAGATICRWCVGTVTVSSNIASVTQVAAQTGDAAGLVLASAETLTKNGAVLKTQVEGFLRELRA